MITVYEPWAHEWMHYQFNKNFLKILLMVYGNQKIVYYGSSDQIKLLQNEINANNLEFVSIHIPDYSKDNKALILCNEYRNLQKISTLMFNELFILQNMPHTMFFAKILMKNRSIFFMMHGGLENFNKKNKFYKVAYYTKFAFKYEFARKNFKYVVLGDSIRNNLLKFIKSSKGNIISIDHPYTVLEHSFINNRGNNDNEYLIGGIGLATFDKNSNKIFDLERFLLMRKFLNVHLYHVGKFECQIPGNTSVILSNTEALLTEDQFNKQINVLDYVVFFYPTYSYKLGASGVIFDAIMHEKPIIAIKNDFFSYIFERSGNIGYLFDTFEELCECVSQISLGYKKNEYSLQVTNIKNAKHLFSPETVAINFKSQL